MALDEALRHCDSVKRVTASKSSSTRPIGNRLMQERPLAEKGRAALFDLLGRRGVDHVGTVSGPRVPNAALWSSRRPGP